MSAGGNYTIAFTTGTLQISNATILAVAADSQSRPYGTANPTLTYSYSGLVNGDTSSVFTGALATSATISSGVGSYSITQGTLSAGANYVVNFTSGTLTVTPASLTVSATPLSKVYGSSDPVLTYSYSGLVNGDGASVFSGTLSRAAGENVGLYAIARNTLSAGANYAITYSAANLTITPEPITVTASANSKTYDGTSAALAIPVISSGNLYGSDSATWSESYSSKNAGTGLTLTPSGSISDGNGGNNYTVTFANNTSGLITAKTLTLSGVTAIDKVYDATTSAVMNFATATLSGIVGSDAVALSTTGYSANFADRNVGAAKSVSASGLSLTGGDAANYQIDTSSATATAAITARPITVTATSNSKTYDGGVSATAVPTITSGALQGSDSASWSETYAGKSVGSALTLTPTGSVSDGNSGNNYAVTFATAATGVITAKTLTASGFAANDKVYDGTTAANMSFGSVALSGLVVGDSVALNSAGYSANFTDKNVGTAKTVTATGLNLTGTDAGNYQLSSNSATATASITALPITVTAAANSKTYDGGTTAATTPTISNGALASGDSANWSESYSSKNVGAGLTLTPSGSVNDGNSGNNYAVTFDANNSGIITARAITVTAAANTKVYDGGLTAAAIPTITVGGLQGSDSASWSETYASKNVGATLTLTPSGSINDGNGGNNYSVTFNSAATGVITPKTLTVSGLTAADKVYDGTSTATMNIAAASLAGIIGTDAVTLNTSGYDANFADKNVGAAKTVSATGLNLTGLDAGNYQLGASSATATAAITALPITVTAAGNSKIYDGGVTAAALPTITAGALQASDTVTWSETYASKNVGTGLTLTPTGTISDGNGGNNYTVTFIPVATGSITARPITVTAATNSKAYDGGLTAAAIPTITTGALQGSDTATWSESYGVKSVGSGLTLTPTGSVSDGNGGANYTVTFAASASGVITAKTLTVAGLTASDKVYDGTTTATMNTAAAALTGVVGSDVVSLSTAGYSANFSDRNVGVGKTVSASGLTLSGADAGNYQLGATSATATANITPLAITVTASGNSKIYDGGTSASATPIITGGALISGDIANFTEAYTSRNVGSGLTLIPAGSVSDGNGGNNYAVSFAAAAGGAITARPITVTASSDSKVYDGGTSASASPVITSGALQGADSASWSESYASKNVGSGLALIPTGSVNDGNGGNNYAITFATSATGSISAKTLTVSGLSASNKIYDGTTSATMDTTSASLMGAIAGDSVSLSTSGYSASFSDKNVGTNKTVSATGLSLAGNDAGNYQLGATSATASGSILARPITVTATSNSKIYDGSATAESSPIVTSGSLVGGDSASWNESYASKNVGFGLTLTPTGSINDGNGGRNYAVTYAPSFGGVIVAEPISVAASANSKIYDGSVTAAAIPTITSGALQGSDSAGWSETYASKTVGTGLTLTPSGSINDGNGGNNYTVTFLASANGAISAKTVAVTGLVASDKTYDGTTAATVNLAAASLSGVVGGDAVSLATTGYGASFADKNVGTGKAVSVSGLSLAGGDAENYQLGATSAITTASITARPITVTAVPNVKVYDGGTSAAATPIITAGSLVSGDTASWSEAYNSKNIGTGLTLTPTGTINDGDGGLNYAVTYVITNSGVINAPVSATVNLPSSIAATIAQAVTPVSVTATAISNDVRSSSNAPTSLAGVAGQTAQLARQAAFSGDGMAEADALANAFANAMLAGTEQLPPPPAPLRRKNSSTGG